MKQKIKVLVGLFKAAGAISVSNRVVDYKLKRVWRDLEHERNLEQYRKDRRKNWIKFKDAKRVQ